MINNFQKTKMSTRDEVILVMKTVAELHKRGYGRLKIFCYKKEGIGAWRHWLFASDSFPSSILDLPPPFVHGSIPWQWSRSIEGSSPDEAANNFIKSHPDIMSAALGEDAVYVQWYSEMLESNHSSILEMESPDNALINGEEISTPYQKTRS